MTHPTVLYVEDEEDYQMLVQRILAKEGMDVQVVPSGEEGLKRLEHVRPGLLILDVNLPDTDGYTLCSELRKRPGGASLPVLMLTVRRRPEEWLRGFSAGANDYVAKPLNPPELVERVRHCLSLYAQAGRESPMADNAEYLLIQAAISGNRRAYEIFIQKYKQRLINSLRGAGRTASEAEDISAIAFAKAYERMSQFQGRSSFYTWLYRIAFTTRMPKSVVDAVPEMQPDPEAHEALSRQALHTQVHKAVSRVPRPYREMLRWHFLRGFSYDTIAQRMGIPRGTVMSRLFTARHLLRKSWDSKRRSEDA